MAETKRLLNARRLKRSTAGSNPALSAISELGPPNMAAPEPWLLVPEFIALFIGMFACWFVAIAYVLWNNRKSRREQLLCIHKNLKQIDLAWSNNEAAIKPASDVDFSKENRHEQKWFLLAGAVLSMASWLGFILLAVLIMSLEFLAKSRVERALFESELAKNKTMPAEAVRTIVNQIR